MKDAIGNPFSLAIGQTLPGTGISISFYKVDFCHFC
jgi:hypothetical protein